MSFPALPTMTRRAFTPGRTRPLSDSPLSTLRERLSGQMKPESARLELKWMREEVRARRTAAASTTASPSRRRNELEWELGELRKMVERRLQGEPLQYILGGYGPTSLPGLAFETSPNCVDGTGDWLSLKRRDLCDPSSCQPFTPVIAF
jgi:hypothetical protein